MRNKAWLYSVILLVAVLVSCQKDLIVKDITDDNVTVLAPGDGINTPYNSITFWWEVVDGAEKYNVQIVSPAFNNIIQLIADTNVTGDKFTKVLQPGTYQWRVRATNNGGNTPWVTRTLTIDSTSNLANLTVGLNSPSDSLYSNNLSQTYSWYSLSSATNYNFQILNASDVVIYSNDQTTTAASYTFTSSADAKYTWRVRAENSYSNSQYFSRKLFIDVTAPTVPVLLKPAINATTTVFNSDSLIWFRASNAYYDSLYVSTDSLFTATIIKTDITGSPFYKIITGNGFPVPQAYYWKVKSIDKAGNQSSFSAYRKFTAH